MLKLQGEKLNVRPRSKVVDDVRDRIATEFATHRNFVANIMITSTSHWHHHIIDH